MKICLSVEADGKIKASRENDNRVSLVYEPKYKQGDAILLKAEHGGYFRIRLEDTMMPSVVYLPNGSMCFPIPFGVYRAGYSPRSFTGKRHFITAEEVDEKDLVFRDLAYNPYDAADVKGAFPHISTNVTYDDSFRNKIFPDKGLFAARNVIDGFGENESHRLFPYQSWGINRNPDAFLHLDFGRPVDVSEIILTIRCEFPHDSWWTEGTLAFSDGTEEIIHLEKTTKPQHFDCIHNNISFVTLKNLKKADDPSPFPALTKWEVFGQEHREK